MFSNPFDRDVVDDLRSSRDETGPVALYTASLEGLGERIRGIGRSEGDSSRGGGEIVLLTSARAGVGKTHFLAQLRNMLAEEALTIPLGFHREQILDWDELLRGLLVFGDESRPSGNDSCVSILQERARQFFAEGVGELIANGEVPCGQREQALRSLREDWRELFDPAGGDAAVAHWFEEVFEALSPSLSDSFARAYGIPIEQASFWVGHLFAYHREAGKGAERRGTALRQIAEGAWGEWRGTTPEMQARERFRVLGDILAGGRPVVYVADHLDAFYEDREGGLDIAAMLVDLAAMLRRGLVVLSVNDDLWHSVFNGHLPSAFEDRLSARRLVLEGVDIEGAWLLIADRMNRSGIPDDVAARFRGILRLEDCYAQAGQLKLSPRSVLRHARAIWDGFASGGFAAGEGDLPGAMEILDMGMVAKKEGSPDPLELPPVDFLQIDDEVEAAPSLVEKEDLDRLFDGSLSGEGGVEPVKPEGHGMDEDRTVRAEGRRMSSEVSGFQQLLSRIRGRTVIPEQKSSFEGELLASRFDRLRADSLVRGVNGGLDLTRLKSVLELVGDRLPVVEQEEERLEGHDGRALAWYFDGDTVLFGFEASTNYPYWQAVVERAIALRRPADEAASEEHFFPPIYPSVKLVVFCPAHEPLEVASWMALHEVFEEGASLIDCVELDEETLAGLYTAGAMIEEVQTGTSSVSREELFALLAREFDYLWSRLTRPIRAEIS